MSQVTFGWLPPLLKKRRQNTRYPMSVARLLLPPTTFEKELPIPWEFGMVYDQKDKPYCVGYSGAYQTSTNANIYGEKRLFDADWLYEEACKIGDTEDGAYIWAACDVLRKKGLIEIVDDKYMSANRRYGIKSYVWAQNVADVRTAIWNNQPVWFGLPWYERFMTPKRINGEDWIATEEDWGTCLGGHAIFSGEWSDKRHAGALVSTWGPFYPNKVWVSADVIQKMLTKLEGECALTLTRFVDPLSRSILEVVRDSIKKYLGCVHD